MRHIARIDSSSILASCRVRFGRARPYRDRKLVGKMEEEKLIESVRDFPCLWNISCKAYKDQRAKENAWKSVTKEASSRSCKNAL